MFVGRDNEVAALAALLERGATGHGGAVVFVGEAGIGKTALLDHTQTIAHNHGMSVWRVSGDELDEGYPFGVVSSLIQHGATGQTRPVEEQAALPPDAPTVALAARLRADDQLTGLIEAAGGPVCIIVDDLHWVDDESLLSLALLLRRVGSLPLVFVAATRPAAGRPAFEQTLSMAERHGSLRHLAPLDRASIQALIDNLGRALTAQEQQSVDAAGGNPFLIGELLALMRAEAHDHILDGTTSGYSEALMRSAVLRRLRLNDDEIAPIVRSAAILGPHATVRDIAALLDESVVSTSSKLERVIRAGVLVADGPTVRFRHDLVRSAVEADIPEPIRIALHREAASILRASGAPSVRVASHVLRSLAGPDAEAMTWILEAASDAFALSPSTAFELLDRAVPHCPAGPIATTINARRAEAALWSGRPTDALAIASTALDDARSIDRSAEPFNDADLRRLDDVRARALFFVGQPVEAVAVSAGRALAPDRLADRALARVLAADPKGAEDDASAVLATPGDEHTAARVLALSVRAWVAMLEPDFPRALTFAAQAVQVADESPSPWAHRYHPRLFQAMVFDAVGRHEEATEAMNRGRQIGVRLGTGWEQPLFDFAQAVAEFREGNWDDALAKSIAGIETADVLGLGMGILWPYAIASVIASFRGDATAASEWIARGQQRSASQPAMLGLDWLVWAQAIAAEEAGDTRGAHDLLALVWDIAESMGIEGSWMVVGPHLARTARQLGDDDRGVRVRDGLAQLAQRAQCVVNDATAAWVRGIVDGDDTALAQASELFGGVHRPWDTALLNADRAVALASIDPDAARSHARESITSLEALGAQQTATRLRSELRAMGITIRTRTVSVRATVGWSALTKTERSVLRHLAEGQTNAAIAERLFVSRRTVESHLGSIYTKLGVGTRYDLMRLAEREIERLG